MTSIENIWGWLIINDFPAFFSARD